METLPPIGKATAEELVKWVDDGILYNNALRSQDFANDLKADLYDAGVQWLRRAGGEGDGPGSYSQFARVNMDPSDPEWIPTPVFNEGFWARINESARLGRAKYRPVVTPTGDNPSIQVREATQKATRMLRNVLRELEWDKEEAIAAYHSPCYGGVWIETTWEQTWDKTTRVPGNEAHCCPRKTDGSKSCGFVLATLEVDEASLPGTVGSNVMVREGSKSRMMACPECDDHPELVPYQESLEEAMGGMDSLGRPMGQETPLGQLSMLVPDPREMFPQNMGLNTRAGSINEWRRVHVESLDWIALRYPSKVGDVKAENSETLAKFHPIAGAPDLFGDSRMFKDSVRVKQWHKKPWMEKNEKTGKYAINKGRSVIVAGGAKLLDAPYLMESLTEPGRAVPRCYVDYAHWELRNGGRHLSGMSMWELMFDPQDIRNEIASQRSSVRQRMAVPLTVWPRNSNFEIKAFRSGTPGRHAEIDIDPNAQTLPRVINNEVINPGVEVESNDAVQYMQKGQAEVERGSVPQNVGAALAIQYLQTAAGEGRQPRIDRWKALLKRSWGVALQLMQAMILEPRPCMYEDETGEEKWDAYRGLDFAGQSNVDVEAEGDVETKAERIAMVRDAFELGLLNVATLSPSQRRRINEYTDMPDDLFQEEDRQREAAQREYIEFREFCESGSAEDAPVIDPSRDDHASHYQEHTMAEDTPYFRDLAKRGNWKGAVAILGPAWKEIVAFVQEPEIVTSPPQDPMNPQPVQPKPPRSTQVRLVEAWVKWLTIAKFVPQDEAATGNVLLWKAHKEAHNIALTPPAAPAAPEATPPAPPAPPAPPQ